MSEFTWLPFFEELLHKICTEYTPKSLYKVWYKFFPNKYNNLDKMDPLSFVGKITSHGDAKLLKYCNDLKKIFNLESSVPEDFVGIPRMDRRNPMFLYEYWKNKDLSELDSIMTNLWDFSRDLSNGNISAEAYNKISKFSLVGFAKLSQIMFLFKPNV